MAVPSSLGNLAPRVMPLSPTSGINAETYTRDLTCGLSAAAVLINAPPYEWPTSTIGPLMLSRTEAM